MSAQEYTLVGVRPLTAAERKPIIAALGVNPLKLLAFLFGSMFLTVVLGMAVQTFVRHPPLPVFFGLMILLGAGLFIPLLLMVSAIRRGRIIQAHQLLDLRSSSGTSLEIFHASKGIYRIRSLDGVEQTSYPQIEWSLAPAPSPQARASGTRTLTTAEASEMDLRIKLGVSSPTIMLIHFPVTLGVGLIIDGVTKGQFGALAVGIGLAGTVAGFVVWALLAEKKLKADIAERLVECRPNGLEFLPRSGLIWRDQGQPAAWRRSVAAPGRKDRVIASKRQADCLPA